MLKSDLVREYLVRFPDHADLTMAKKIYKENPLVFTSMESTRSLIRNVKGKTGWELKDKSLYT